MQKGCEKCLHDIGATGLRLEGEYQKFHYQESLKIDPQEEMVPQEKAMKENLATINVYNPR